MVAPLGAASAGVYAILGLFTNPTIPEVQMMFTPS